jgi:hypothetical protein
MKFYIQACVLIPENGFGHYRDFDLIVNSNSTENAKKKINKYAKKIGWKRGDYRFITKQMFYRDVGFYPLVEL